MLFGRVFRPEPFRPRAWGRRPWAFLCRLSDTLRLSDTALSDRDRLDQTDHKPQTTDTFVRAGHELVCLVLGWNPSTACA